MRKCPYCAELVHPDAKLCKHCGKDIAPTPTLSLNYFYNKEHERPKQTLSSSNVRYYFSTDGEQHQGPMDASDLKLLREDNLITDDTLMIREGESEWRSFRDYFPLNK